MWKVGIASTFLLSAAQAAPNLQWWNPETSSRDWNHWGTRTAWGGHSTSVQNWPGAPQQTSWGFPGQGPPGYGGSSSAATKTTTATSSASLGACAKVSALAVSSKSASPKATPTVPAALAYECINSVPFNASAAVDYLDSIRPYINWQTTIEYLKDPPAEYAAKIQPPYDFYAQWDRIYAKAKANGYASEYAFGYDLYVAFQATHDGHFVVYPDSVNSIFSYGRTAPLVSVSLDGVSVPEVYVYSDILAKTSAGNASIGFTPSPLRQIDGQDSTQWLLNFSQVGSLQDRDALWNNVFYLLGQVSLGSSGTGTGTFSGGGRGRWKYPGATTTLTFANGTTLVLNNFARVLVPFDGVQTGADLYQKFFAIPAGGVTAAGAPTPAPTSSAPPASSSAPASTSSASSTTIPAPGYPSPIVREKNNLNSGYFLSGAGYDDVAVLSVPSFVGSGADELDFKATNVYLIEQAVKAGKTKLIIDVSANGGGTILQGYDLFKQLFPSILPYGATRFRAHEAVDYIGQEISYYSGLVPRSLDTNDTVQNLVSSAFNYRTDVDVNYKNFDSWAQKYGPHAYGPQPDNFTSIIRWNISDVLTPDNSGGINISNSDPANLSPQPFKAENIVIVYDGYCASTCTIFSELMRQQAGVKTIALGGRPNKNIIQAVGGVKGTNDFGAADIFSYAQVPFTTEYLHSAGFYNTTALGAYNDLAITRSVTLNLNVRDGMRQGDAAQTPLQFVYEPADCRIFYTPAMAVDQTAAWKTVADTAFNGRSHCVAGTYPASNSSQGRRSSAKRAVGTVAARKGLDVAAHYAAIEEVWTGKDGYTQRGDSVMLL